MKKSVAEIIRRQYFGLKKEYERTLDFKCAIRRQIISPQWALDMAKNIFVDGDLKRLRATFRQHKKRATTCSKYFLPRCGLCRDMRRI